METYRTRLETGLTFLEFNYVLLQAYDFLELYRRYGCTLQIGGQRPVVERPGRGAPDRARRAASQAFALTWPLLMDQSGAKMGKSQAGGQVWLDPAEDAAVRVLPALDQRRRRQRRPRPGRRSPSCPWTEIRALTGRRRRLAAGSQATPGAGGHHPGARARRRPPTRERAAQALFGGRGPPAGGTVEGVPTVRDRPRRASTPASRPSICWWRSGWSSPATGPGS